MEKIIGLDLGTNSIGWAIREVNNELENQIIDKGVLTFDKGVGEEKGIEVPIVKTRTVARGKRRNYQAEKYRKWELLECLIENNMCPLFIDELNEWRHYKKGIGRKYPQSEKFIQWLQFDFDGDGKPDFERLGFSKHESYYLFRKLIVDESKVEIFKNEPLITGRVLYQLVQRRGYNDGDSIDESEKDELSKTIMKGGGEAGAVGVNDILPYLEKYKTLGAALYELQKEQKARIRNRYNLRSHYKKEIEEICRVQGLENLLKPLQSAIIWQRPLRSQKGLVGVCTFEKNKRRCPISHPLYEEYRTWVFINNLKIRPSTYDELKTEDQRAHELRTVLKDIVYPQFYKTKDFELSSIKKAIAKVGFEITARFPEDTKVVNVSFLHKIKELFGDDWTNITGWNDLLKNSSKKVKYNIEDLWHLHFTKTDNKNTGESSFGFIKRFAITKLQLSDEKAEAFAKIRLQQGYATLSINAIKKILPYLQKGFIYSEAVYLANLPKVMGKELKDGDIDNYATIIKDAIRQDKDDRKKVEIVNSLITQFFEDKKSFELNKYNLIEKQIIESFGITTWNKISIEKQLSIQNVITQEINSFLQEPKQKPENHYRKTGRLHDKIFIKLMDDYGLPAENIKHLWHPSEQETYAPAIEKDGKGFLGSPEPISKGFKNPMALKTMHKLKRLINYLIEIGKIDKDTRVVIEIARELNDANKRKAIERWQRDREKENETYKKQIEEINRECKTDFDVNDKNLINKIRLWNEQNRRCLYTGKTINLCDILDGSKYDFEHSIPASMSFDNELKNLTIADKTYNQQIKGKRLPSECPNYEDEALGFSAILPRLDFMKDKIEHYETLYDRYKFFAKNAQNKESKDRNIVDKHIAKMQLDYWRYKLLTFTTKEYKAGWRNSQLRDTQTITKYTLPYLKTIFNKVEVQKGNITADFRKIYEIQPRSEKKERTKHSHHAIDAAVLTLIPPASVRDKILLRYNEAEENNQGYHEKPRQWDKFHQEHILSIEDDVLINYQAQHRTLTPTYKTVRKRGKIQYVKEKLPDGKWQYKLDKEGNKIPLKANGDSIRGQLHKESFFGAIKNKGELNLVERYSITAFTSINDCKNIVDDAVREIVKNELEKRIADGMSFDKAKIEPVPFPNGKAVIKKVRCKVLAGAGYLRYEKAEKIRTHNFINPNHIYKHSIYAQNNEMAYLLYYEKSIDNKTFRTFKIIGLFELGQLKLKKETELLSENYYKTITTGKGKNETILENPYILKAGTKCIFYKENLEELKDLYKENIKEFLRRIFVIYKYNTETSTNFVYLKNHLEARADKDIKEKEYRTIDLDNYQSRLQFTADKFICAIEGKHFIINPDGTINWKF